MQISKQVAHRKANVTGWRGTVSQLHGPSVVLIGDAAHSVTPPTGSGMNAALEDAALLGKILDALDRDLDPLPEAFNATRLGDALALHWLDSVMPYRFGRRGRSHWRYIFAEAQAHARRLLRWVLGSRVDQNAYVKMGRPSLTFSQVKRAVVAEDIITGFALSAAAAVLAASAWALRFRLLGLLGPGQ